jgi:hypothetical protein
MKGRQMAKTRRIESSEVPTTKQQSALDLKRIQENEDIGNLKDEVKKHAKREAELIKQLSACRDAKARAKQQLDAAIAEVARNQRPNANG